MSGITFQVETERVLQILSREIYDSPLALLRENVQNAYDAVRMRFARAGRLSEGEIRIDLNDREVVITDNGVGMTEDVLRNNFWKAGSSGKNTADARQSGVVGTFGIGAMANFGVCESLSVETRAEGSGIRLRAGTRRDSLRISEECISLESIEPRGEVGTRISVVLDSQHTIAVSAARDYLLPYVQFLPVQVYLNGALLSGHKLETGLGASVREFKSVGSERISDATCEALFEIRTDGKTRVMVVVSHVSLGGTDVPGEMLLLQSGGQLMGLRFRFGLAPVPVAGSYQFGGFADLSFLQPTAGREALDRSSIDQVARLVALAERAASNVLATSDLSDGNTAFQSWVVRNGEWAIAAQVTIRVLPEDSRVPLGALRDYVDDRQIYYYTGTDEHILATFAGERSWLVQVAQVNPRKQLQLHWVQKILHIEQVPDAAQVTKVYAGPDLTSAEASIVIRATTILRDDYLVSDVEVLFADISHRVAILAQQEQGGLRVYLDRSGAVLPSLVQCYENAYDVFGGFMKDFVRVHIYPRIQQFVPSSTRGGVDALRAHLLRTRELYRYEETEQGQLEGVVGDFMSGSATLSEVLSVSKVAIRAHRQHVSFDQVGAVEGVVPDVVVSPVSVSVDPTGQIEAQPPIVRDDVSSEMKILTAAAPVPQLNNFTMLLGLSDRLMRAEAGFFHVPHTTRIMWGGHRVVYIFTEATGRLSLYYDIELKESIGSTLAGGGAVPTTTLITRNRIFVPVPDALKAAFAVDSGPKEFFVRFDLLYSGSG